MNDSEDTSIPKVKEVPFWSENPNVLLKPEYVTELFPSGDMSFSQKLNAITRLVVVVTCVVFAYSQELRGILFGAISLMAIYLVHYFHVTRNPPSEGMSVSFEDKDPNPAHVAMLSHHAEIPKDVFDDPTSSNPFSNVLLTDYTENPEKKPAPPAFNENVNVSILDQAKQFVRETNPDQPDIADKLFNDLGEQLVFEQSMRPFYSTSSTSVPNDQQAFTDFCYGNMVSCKEGNMFACARNLARYTNT
jgi:Family of unknown function (DUF5762)